MSDFVEQFKANVSEDEEVDVFRFTKPLSEFPMLQAQLAPQGVIELLIREEVMAMRVKPMTMARSAMLAEVPKDMPHAGGRTIVDWASAPQLDYYGLCEMIVSANPNRETVTVWLSFCRTRDAKPKTDFRFDPMKLRSRDLPTVMRELKRSPNYHLLVSWLVDRSILHGDIVSADNYMDCAREFSAIMKYLIEELCEQTTIDAFESVLFKYGLAAIRG